MKKEVVALVIFLILATVSFSFLVLDTQKIASYLPMISDRPENHSSPYIPNEPERTQRITSGFEEDSPSAPGNDPEASPTEEWGDNDCLRQFSYAVSSFNQIRGPSGLNCSLIVRNLEYDYSGDFTVRISLIGPNSEEIASSEITHNLPQRQEALFDNLFVQASESDTCEYETLSVPKKTLCE
jgi:hypothetical protein